MLNEALYPFLNDLVREHRQMHRYVQALRESIQAGNTGGWTEARAAEAGACLRQLRDFAREHFLHEEEDGCLEDAIAMMPACATSVAALRHEHAEILAALDRFQAAAVLDDNRPDYWAMFAGQIDELLKQLADHERREARLIADAFNVAPDEI